MDKQLLEISPRESPIIEINFYNFSEYEHLLRPPERRPASEVIKYVQHSGMSIGQCKNLTLPERAVSMYLGGGVIKNPLFNKPGRTHSDVDLLAVGKQPVLEELARHLIQASKTGEPIIKYGRGAAEVNIGVEHLTDEYNRAYFDLPLEERFILNVTKPENSRACPIDLSIVSREKFEEYCVKKSES